MEMLKSLDEMFDRHYYIIKIFEGIIEMVFNKNNLFY